MQAWTEPTAAHTRKSWAHCVWAGVQFTMGLHFRILCVLGPIVLGILADAQFVSQARVQLILEVSLPVPLPVSRVCWWNPPGAVVQ